MSVFPRGWRRRMGTAACTLALALGAAGPTAAGHVPKGRGAAPAGSAAPQCAVQGAHRPTVDDLQGLDLQEGRRGAHRALTGPPRRPACRPRPRPPRPRSRAG
ncbi:hypothetical protein MOF7_06455 [Methylobacterium oryzae]